MMKPPFQSVARVALSEWAEAPHALSRAKPGDLLHTGELHERKGGLLKLRRVGSFITISVAQAWDGDPIPWPRPEDGIHSIIIEPGTGNVSLVPRDRPESFSSSPPS